MMEVNIKSGSNLPQVIWKVEILNTVDDSKSQSKDVNGHITKVTWRIPNFSSFKKDQKLFSEHFSVDGNKWRILIFPKGNKVVDHLSIYLDVAVSTALLSGWNRFAQIGFTVIDQMDPRNSITKVTTMHEFNMAESDWGFNCFLALGELYDPKRGYLANDTCLVEAYISTDRTDDLISHKLIFETDLDKHKTKEADGVKATVDNQTTVKTKPVEITTPSPTQPSFQIVASQAIEPGQPTEEDIKTFFTSLESELSSSDTVFSKEEAKEALSKLDEAMNMTPVDFYNSGKFSPLKQAFKILASFKYSSTTLAIEQKNELLAMEESLKEVADRAATAVQDKSQQAIMRNLNCNLVRYKEVESEVKLIEQKLGALLAERKGLFRSSKEMKMELEAVGKEWTEYEANAKTAEEEEKSVEA
ncbi:hypothetical protein V6N11_070321 [Hibiscus sabdariffa]|uniref:MATH domain-containing protein n=1 Tax=Hibiscus sabdariffa TaxID=183260 RepID=A0ABR2QEX4_9ROSI